jgi:dihydrofolate reductase
MPKPKISLIAAMAANSVIGIDNTLPWRLPTDLQHFKRLTLGHHILMGRKTWESLPGKLPGRTHVVITRDPGYRAEGALIAHSLEEALTVCADDSEIFFIGGENLYRQALVLADRLYLTEIRRDFAGDAWFPEFDRNVWRETERQREAMDGTDGLEYDFVIYDKES